MNNTHTIAVNRSNQRYTAEDKATIANNIKSFPDNIQEALRQSSIQIGRSLGSVQWQYYQGGIKHSHNVVTVGSTKGFSHKNVKNRANLSINQTETLVPRLRPFQRIVSEMLTLEPRDLERILEFFRD